MWEPPVIIATVLGMVAILSNVIAITVFVVKLSGKMDVNHTQLTGKIDVMDTRVKSVETNIADLKNTDRRLSLVEDRQAALATRQGNMEQDNLLIREDLGKLHQGLDRHTASLQRFNDAQFSK
jgi:VIT1/CCC1 family predicted Fe2+/Mn2+ transporter